MKNFIKSKVDDCEVDPEYYEIHELKGGCPMPFYGKCSLCGKKYDGYGTCLFCQKGKMMPIL